jgi:hypothetical protein
MEPIALRFNGGPIEGTITIEGNWPPPDEIRIGTDIYRKTVQSKLSDDEFAPVARYLIRGAEYEWLPSREQAGTDAIGGNSTKKEI